MEPNNNGIQAWQWIVTIIVIIVLIVIGVFVFRGKNTATPADDNTGTTTSDNTNTTGTNRIVMSDQYPGNVVNLSSVQLDAPGWVVIQGDNAGQPGAILGETYFAAGINPGKVTLTKPTVEGGTYYAVIYTDDGDQKFDATKDMPLKDTNGNIILRVFHASSSVDAGMKG